MTGAAVGIGCAITEAVVAANATVVTVDRDEHGLQHFEQTSRVLPRVLDITNLSAIKQLFADLAAVDVVVNCAGVVPEGSILKCQDSDWELAMNVNVRGSLNIIKAALPGMLARRSGCIINVASVVSSIKGVRNRFIYGTSKAAVIGLTKAVATDFADQGICCNAICPGTIDTPSLRTRIAATPDPAKSKQNYLARQPMGRFGIAEEIAGMALYLASDLGRFTTGATLVVDSGFSL